MTEDEWVELDMALVRSLHRTYSLSQVADAEEEEDENQLQSRPSIFDLQSQIKSDLSKCRHTLKKNGTLLDFMFSEDKLEDNWTEMIDNGQIDTYDAFVMLRRH